MKEIKGLIPGVTVRMHGVLERSGRTKAFALSDLAWRRSNEATATGWRSGRGRLVSVDLWTREPRAGRAEIIAGVSGQRGWSLSEWTFEVRIATGADDRFTWPFSSGAVLPVAELLKAGKTLELTYPVYASMQWVDLFGRGGGTYAAAHDAEPYFKHLRVHAERRGAERTLVLEFIYTDLQWPADKIWSSPPLVLVRHEGDWREGSRIYRDWANSWFRREPMPEFMQRSAGHNMISFPSGGGRVAFKDLAKRAADARRLGVDGVHIADWMEEGFDTFYPAYEANPKLGGEKELRKAIQRIASEGSWTCMYLNGRLLDPAGPHGKHAFEWAAKLPPRVRRRFAEMWKRTQDFSRPGWRPDQAVPIRPAPFNRDGTAAEEWWGRILSPMCPAVPGWRTLWLSRMKDVAAKYRPRMFQVDQVCGCWGMPCYDENHPHISPALAWSGYKDFTWAMRHRAHEVDPEIGFWSEGVNDVLGQAFDGLQTNLGFKSLLAGLGQWDPRVFKHTFPEYVLVTGDVSRSDDVSSLAWAIITGGHFHFFIENPADLSVRTREWIRFAIRIRTRYWGLFTSNDVFVPDVSGDAGLRVFGYRSGKRRLLVGAPFEPNGDVERRFNVRIEIPGKAARIVRAEWADTTARTKVHVTRAKCAVAGAGAFVLLLVDDDL